ncbi:hypothetical protein FRC18_001225 [Serendipita sp. 400]|nr:hypothetical protein FRC18_001225 [Serendipita sp. 400]
MPTPRSVELASDKELIHIVASQFNITFDQAVSLIYWQPEIIIKLRQGLLPPNHASTAVTLMRIVSAHVTRQGLLQPEPAPIRQARRKPQIDRQLTEAAQDDFDYSKLEGGALGLTVGPTAAQMWFLDPHPQLAEFLKRPHPAISA